MKNAVIWDVALCSSCVNRCFRGTYCLHIRGRKIRERGTSMSRWLLNLNIFRINKFSGLNYLTQHKIIQINYGFKHSIICNTTPVLWKWQQLNRNNKICIFLQQKRTLYSTEEWKVTWWFVCCIKSNSKEIMIFWFSGSEQEKVICERLLPSLPSFMKGDSAALVPDSCAEPPMPPWGVDWGVQASILIQWWPDIVTVPKGLIQ
jgi:hypothetical protein